MRSPTTTLAGNLRWTRSGTVWADWLLSPLPYGFRPDKDKNLVRGMHQALLRALPGESLLQGVCSTLDAAAVVERMIDGVDLAACPQWAAECEASLDTLDQISPGQRSYWLSVPLGAHDRAGRLREPARAALAGIRDQLALPRAGVPTVEFERRLEQARRVAAAIPHLLRPRPATPAQMLWLHLHAQQRGAQVDLDLPDSAPDDLTGRLLTPRPGMSLPEPMLDEGGRSDLSGRRGWNPLDRRYLKISQPGRPDLPAASYQALLVLTDVPAQGMVHPGSEWLGRIDESGLDVDWALRLQVLASHDATRKNRRALLHLNEQYGQREGELGQNLRSLDRAASELAEYAAVLEADAFEVEVQPTTIMVVAGPNPQSTADQARALTGYFADAGYKLTQPLGFQEELWWATQPGVPASRAVREFAQVTTSRALASAMPLASTELGDDRGSLLGLNISSGRPGVVLHDMEGAAVRDVSGSVAVVGELGAGKALAVDVPIPTPTGWTVMGELRPGDEVLDDQGHPTVVLGVSPVQLARTCYRVQFCDGSTVVADTEHLWSTVTDQRPRFYAHVSGTRRAGGGTDVLDLAEHTAEQVGSNWPERAAAMSTAQLRSGLLAGGQVSHAIPVAGALQLPDVDLPIDPYVLGTWLGKGTRRAAGITTADLPGTRRIDGVGGATSTLAGRHVDAARPAPQRPPVRIPPAYLRAGEAQRRALLAGLLDAAGAVAGAVAGGGSVEFGSTRRLAVDVHELTCSLGYRPALRKGRARLHGRGGAATWTVSFATTDVVFGLACMQQAHQDRSGQSGPACHRLRHITGVVPVSSVPVRCIRVASASRLFLAGRSMIPTHNSVTLKSLAGDVVDRGGVVIAVDRTQMGEYAVWASSVTAATVVDAADPRWSLDPLRLFGAAVGSRVCQSFLTPLLNVAPTSERGVLLSDVLDAAYLARHQLDSLGGLLAHLGDDSQDGCRLPGAGELARVMNVFARRDFGRVVFDPALPVLPTTAPAVVVRTHTLEQPSRDELTHEHLFRQMGVEKLFGRALYALVAALARQLCFTDPARLGVFVVDEAHHVTASPEGEREIALFSRDGRKHKAAVLLGTHDPEEDLGSATLRGLIPTRILMRHRDKTLAARGLAYLGLDPADDELLQMLTEDTSPVTAKGVAEHRRGEAFVRDSSGNIGRVKILGPALPARAAAVRTSPPQAQAAPDLTGP